VWNAGLCRLARSAAEKNELMSSVTAPPQRTWNLNGEAHVTVVSLKNAIREIRTVRPIGVMEIFRRSSDVNSAL
jgi:hypothetical protein